MRLIGVTLSGFVWQEKQAASLQSGFLPGLDMGSLDKSRLPGQEKRQGAKETDLKERRASGNISPLPELDLKKENRLERAIDKVRERYGRASLKRAALLRASEEDMETEVEKGSGGE